MKVMHREQGFTLIELMITVVIVAILAAVAYPSYQNHIIRGNRAAAQQFMLDVAERQAAFLLDARSYAATLGAGGLNVAVPSEVSRHYNVTVAVGAAPPSYTITATPVAGSTQASDATLTLDNLGQKTPAAKW